MGLAPFRESRPFATSVGATLLTGPSVLLKSYETRSERAKQPRTT